MLEVLEDCAESRLLTKQHPEGPQHNMLEVFEDCAESR
jgi:hypothetical protein